MTEKITEMKMSTQERSGSRPGLAFIFDGKYVALREGLFIETHTGAKTEFTGHDG